VHLRTSPPDRPQRLAHRHLPNRPGEQGFEFHPVAIDRFPHIGRDVGAGQPRIAAHRAEHLPDIARIGWPPQHEVPDLHAIIAIMQRLIGAPEAERGDHRAPFRLCGHNIARQGHAQRCFEQARGVFGPLKIAEHPEQSVGGAA
jgi:hypothetical protein